MTWFTSLVATQRGRSLVGTLGVMLAVIALVGAVVLLSRCGADEKAEQAVTVDRADAVAEAAERVRAADAAVAMNETQRADELANEQQELSREADKGDDGSVGPGTAAVLERLRRQQAAR